MNLLLVIACLAADLPSDTGPVKVGVTDFPPMIIVDDNRISGSDYDMFEEITRSLGWKEGEDYEYRIFRTFDELLEALETGSVDLGLSGISITHDRLLLMHFSQPYKKSGQRILIPPTKPKWSFHAYYGRFVRPEIAVPLASLIGCWVIFGLLFWAWETKPWKAKPAGGLVGVGGVTEAPEEPEKEVNIRHIGDGAKAAFDIGTTIGFGRYFPTTRLGQWVLAVACFFCSSLLIGDVISTLTVNKVEKLDNIISCPDDLKGKIVAAIENTTSVDVAQEYAPARVIETRTFYEAVVEVRLGNAVAVVADDPVVLYYVKNNPEHAMATGLRFHPEDYGIAFAMGQGDLVKKFSLAIAKLRESDKLGFIEDHWFGE